MELLQLSSCFFGLRLTGVSQGRTTVPAAFNAASSQIRGYAAEGKATPTEVSSILEQRIRGVKDESGLAETGRVLSVGYVLTNNDFQYNNHHNRTEEGILTNGCNLQ